MECDYEKYSCELLDKSAIDHDLSFKIVIIGNSGVGKSSITTQAIKNNYDDNYKATIGFEFFVLNYKIDNRLVKLQIWDTCGQEIYRSIVANFYRSSSLAFLVYSIDNKESFDELWSWLTELRMYSSPEIKVFLIGNKCDLTETRQVTYEEGLKFQQESKIDYFTETSAKIKHNTAEAFENCAKLLYSEYLKLKEQFGSSEQVGTYTSYDTRNSVYSFKLGKKIRSKDNLNGNKENKDIRESNEVLDKESNQGCRC